MLSHPDAAGSGLCFFIISKGERVIVIVTVIILTGGDAVAEHLYNIAGWHRHALKSFVRVDRHIDPVFKMMTVPSLVMKPGGGIALCYFLAVIGTSFSTLIILYSLNKLGWGIFGPVMHDTLFVKPGFKAVVADKLLVMKDRPQMTNKIIPVVHFISFP